MKIERLVVGSLQTNGYILYDEKSKEAFIIDPGDEASKFLNYIEKYGLNPIGIILTHYHHDHIGAVSSIQKKCHIPIFIHKDDVEGLKNPYLNYSEDISITPNKIVKDKDEIKGRNIILEVIHTPGHTPGGICLKVKNENIIFTGDTIFNIDIGRTDLAGSDPYAMLDSMKNKISKWEDDIVIYPGHGEKATMSFVRKNNMEYIYAITR
ncbi:MBL fold metallo-hydrolase [Inediibacterium massiliense]|uniref:MBL fold metallo-hydrolase n=1 Tax=Inediibacterium massiliense TaxID=1658111 RepID=UPI0006B56AEE|nr:MBL fold metallo-hydrolase [Inediibacterium massiliense]